MKDAREKLIQKDARFKIRGRGGAASGGGVQDARQMINSRKQQQNVFTGPIQTIQKTAVTHQLQSHSLVPQIKIQANNNFAGANMRLFAQNVQGLSGRDGTIGHLNKGMTDARDRLSLKRSMSSGLQSQASTLLPLKITKTIQVRRKVFLYILHAICCPVEFYQQIEIHCPTFILQQRPVGVLGGMRLHSQVFI